jgi:hypothetical protein
MDDDEDAGVDDDNDATTERWQDPQAMEKNIITSDGSIRFK